MSTVQSCTNFLESPIFDPCVRYPTPITIIHLLRLATSFLGLELPNKGQLISKELFGVFKSTKKNNEMFEGISALASKRRSNNKKVKVLFYVKLQKVFYLNDSYFIFTLEMESVPKYTIFGLKIMVKSGLEKFILKFLPSYFYY